MCVISDTVMHSHVDGVGGNGVGGNGVTVIHSHADGVGGESP
jgi:hypothetical protein